jgi:hypothetical protein
MFCSSVWSTPDRMTFQVHPSGMCSTIPPIETASRRESFRRCSVDKRRPAIRPTITPSSRNTSRTNDFFIASPFSGNNLRIAEARKEPSLFPRVFVLRHYSIGVPTWQTQVLDRIYSIHVADSALRSFCSLGKAKPRQPFSSPIPKVSIQKIQPASQPSSGNSSTRPKMNHSSLVPPLGCLIPHAVQKCPTK